MQLNAKNVIIVGVGHEHPVHRIENSFFESLDNGSEAEWVGDRTGILSRHSVLDADTLRDLRFDRKDVQQLFKNGEIPSIASLAKTPWAMALERNGKTNPSFACDLVISGCSVPDYDIPANASVIASNLGIQAASYDVNSACSSFCTDLISTYSQLKVGFSSQAAIFNIERYSLRLDYKDRRSCVLFGDGAACTLLRTEEKQKLTGFRIIDLVMHSDPQGYDAVVIPEGGMFNQNGAKVQKFAISKTVEVSQEILQRNNLTPGDLSYFIGHQANLRMLQSTVQKLDLDPAKHLYNVDQFGNQGAAGAPIVLSQNWDRFKPKDLVLISVVGAGLTWGSALLEWQA